jgi:Septum formation initiator
MVTQSTSGKNLTRLMIQLRILQGATKVVFMMFCIAIGFVVVATAVPQHRELKKLEAKLELIKQREVLVRADRDYHQIEHRALREDPEFLEIHARDRLNFYREGERILSFREGP